MKKATNLKFEISSWISDEDKLAEVMEKAKQLRDEKAIQFIIQKIMFLQRRKNSS